jgi:hypothetical protein
MRGRHHAALGRQGGLQYTALGRQCGRHSVAWIARHPCMPQNAGVSTHHGCAAWIARHPCRIRVDTVYGMDRVRGMDIAPPRVDIALLCNMTQACLVLHCNMTQAGVALLATGPAAVQCPGRRLV